MPGDIGFIARFGLLSGLRQQETIYIQKKRFVVMVMVVTAIAYIQLTVKMD